MGATFFYKKIISQSYLREKVKKHIEYLYLNPKKTH